jgi:DtxR family Mn-dependent transcriptional regulator
MQVSQHPPIEEYLETIYSLAEEGVPVIQARIAERLSKKPASVSEMLERLIEEKYVVKKGRVITLTKKGEDLANSVVRKHRLAERLLVDVIGLPWHKAHQEAGRWEHVISDEVETYILKLLDNPETCPHGNPIPGMKKSKSEVVSLNEVAEGKKVRLARISEKIELDADTLAYLDQSGFIPGKSGTVNRRSNDGVTEINVGGKFLAFGPKISKELFVELC